MKKQYLIAACIAFFALSFQNAFAQCEEMANLCNKNFDPEYISDGQEYRALLYEDQVAEFQTTLFGGNTYRMAACSGDADGNLVFRIYDQEKNLLFTNSEFSNSAYWDFRVENTLVCTVETQLDVNKSESGCAVLLIGFEQ